MKTSHAYRPRSRAGSQETRERIVAAVRELLEEGGFHEATVEEVAARAGVSRATLYQHFGSRLGLVDAICETFARSQELQSLKRSAELPDPVRALDEVIIDCARFWARQEAVLAPLYGVASVDPAAAGLVERQRRDRRRVFGRLARRLHAGGLLHRGLGERRALGILLLLTSFDSFLELRRHAGLTERDVSRELRTAARALLLAP